MRFYVLAIVAAALYVLPTSAFAQRQGDIFEPSQYRQHGRSAYRGECRELRQACLHKGELGERGMGNCRRYREMCR
ncbi:MAG: hypothetical protein C3F11_13290 [Methylocystaceae bacterium]|nr:MAG: hypothetical protein C3F11_13290 [Methylocystaceae bacterium]